MSSGSASHTHRHSIPSHSIALMESKKHNIDSRKGKGLHWVLALWRWHRRSPRITPWEPYPHTKYSQPVATAITKAFPHATVSPPIPVGEQEGGDGWSCGCVCVYWQIIMQRLVNLDSAAHAWARPIEPLDCGSTWHEWCCEFTTSSWPPNGPSCARAPARYAARHSGPTLPGRNRPGILC